MHPNVARVSEAARQSGIEIEVRRFVEQTRTAEEAARAIGCGVDQIVKSLAFVADEAPILALVSGTHRVDETRLANAAGAAATRRVSGQEARRATGFAIGGVPPFGHDTPLRVLVDRALLDHPVVWAAAGLPDAVFPIAPADLVRASGGEVVDIAERPGER